MTTIFILGAGGFLGRAVARHYRELGWRTVCVGRGAGSLPAQGGHDWTLPHHEFAKLLAEERPALCVNCAGRASVAASMTDPLADFGAATLLNFRILDDLRLHSPATIYLHISSAAVYGNPTELPIAEDAPIAPISPYGWHKRFSEQVLEEFAVLFGIRTASLRIFSAYGPQLQRQVVWDLAVRALASEAGPLVLRGLSDDSRDFIHGRDVAVAAQLIAERGALSGECYNVASGAETKIATIAQLVIEAVGSSSNIAFDQERPAGNPARWHADIGRLMALGFRPGTTLVDGIAEVVEAARSMGQRQ